MKSESIYFHSSDQLTETLSIEISEVFDSVGTVNWSREFSFSDGNRRYQHQTGYNKAIANEFQDRGWESNPILRTKPKLIGDFRKGLVFVEVQFGNSSTLYRDYYKFQYGLANGLLSLAILIVPTKPRGFFPTRPNSVRNMAEYTIAENYLSVLPINVPTLLIGLLPNN
ncbi:MAG: BglII/BstYI family type II restriction endonuclease [Pseudomonadales bacterium]|jgi:hypothetical protein|nr:BglII/BstYI family type II restriction endonuclease [Pseudomonadales bacterium]|tara:strand:- start:385 stop:891 length:507 start_codon:yes stop_codon:yes gene_type:complete